MQGNKRKKKSQPRHQSKRPRIEETTGSESVATNSDSSNRQQRPDAWRKFELINASFEEYYSNLPIMEPEERVAFFQHLRQELPSSFRVNSSSVFNYTVAKRVQDLVGGMSGVSFKLTPDAEEEPILVDPPKPLRWYPSVIDASGNAFPAAWEFSVPKRFLKKLEQIREFNQFLVEQDNLGTITRQEAVSMIPPLFLDVQPHHHVLDMCAAPGSKTSQLIEMLHGCGNYHEMDKMSRMPTGFVIANDADKKRCTTLTHQMNRFTSPCICITHHQAQFFPSLTTEEGPIAFDRILCDVPCSGDGTLRKNPDLWEKWNPAMGPGLHGVQLSIAYRAFQLLKPGGRMVYSTCSLNPTEDEAVVIALLQKFKGHLELVDVSTSLPELKRRPGITSWKVMDKACQWYSSHAELPEHLQSKISASCFPPSPEDNVAEYHIERCFRILPQDQDTGGFFVAVFQKLSHMPEPLSKRQQRLAEKQQQQQQQQQQQAEEEMKKEIKQDNAQEETKREEEVQQDNSEAQKEPQQNNKPPSAKSNERINKSKDALIPLSERTLPYWETTKNFFGISDEFPYSRLMCHSTNDRPHKISFTSPLLTEILRLNPRLHVIGAGFVILSPVSPKNMGVDYRPASIQAGAFIGPFTSKRLIQLDSSTKEEEGAEGAGGDGGDIGKLLEDPGGPFFNQLSSRTKKVLEEMEATGPCLFVDESLGFRVYLPGWRGAVSCKLLCAGPERSQLLSLYGRPPLFKKDNEDTIAMETENPLCYIQRLVSDAQ